MSHLTSPNKHSRDISATDLDKQDEITKFLCSWAWKREHLPDKLRFNRPYKYPLDESLRLQHGVMDVTIHQQSFKAEGFASTVWDSSILMSKFIEHNPTLVAGKRVCDVSAGTGLVGIVAALAGATEVIATDLPGNLALLHRNIEFNGVRQNVTTKALAWGTADAQQLAPPFQVAIACDVMYIVEAVEPLVATLKELIGGSGRAIVAHGRNCCAEDDFVRCARCAGLGVRTLSEAALHPRYRAQDITVLLLEAHGSRSPPSVSPTAREACIPLNPRM